MNFHFKNITNFINTKILKKKFTYTTFFKNCQFHKYIPKNNNETVKNIESITDISEKSICWQFKDHFHSKYHTENQIAHFHSSSQEFRLTMIFNSHAKGIGENTKENKPLEPIVIHEDFHTILNFGATFSNRCKHSSE